MDKKSNVSNDFHISLKLNIQYTFIVGVVVYHKPPDKATKKKKKITPVLWAEKPCML